MTLAAAAKPTHTNPVYGSYFADPYVWKQGDTYYAIGTGELEATGKTIGKVFPLLQSSDFFQWTPAGSALIRPEHSLGANFWAPAVAYSKEKFYLYYSVGHEDKNHQLRVALSDSPQGPYKDLGRALLDPAKCAFAIDPHPFQDEDGTWYMFYARDFLDVTSQARAGTSLMVARMKNMTELRDEGSVVLRPRQDWQRFEADRQIYDGTYATGIRSRGHASANMKGDIIVSTAEDAGKIRPTAWTMPWPTMCSGPIPTRATRMGRTYCAPFQIT